MITWILQSSLCWLFFLIIYKAFLQKETFFRFNRYYLLGTLLLGAIIPLLRLLWDQWTVQDKELPVYAAFQGTARILEFQVNSPTGLSAMDWFGILSLIYWVGLVVSFGLLARECHGILRLIRNCPKQRKGDYIQVTTDFEHLPFSFLHFIFISDRVKFKDRELNRILRHETSHVTDWHTLDVLIIELISVLAWWSPMVYWYKKSIRNTHEYLADALVTLSEDKNSYGRLLIDHSQRGLHMALANHFIYSQLKNRINMMMKSRSRPVQAWKYALIIPMLFLLGLLFAYKSDVIHHPNVQSSKILIDSIYTEVDVMPLFPGCNHLNSVDERFKCSNQKLMEFLKKSIRYPLDAKNSGFEGKAVVSFVVNTDGSISNTDLINDPGKGTGEEALRVVQSLKLTEKWTPAQLGGKSVRVKLQLPIAFRLDAQDKSVAQLPPSALYVLNGDRVNLEEIQNIPPDQIASMKVYKELAAVEKYGDDARDGAVEIITIPKYVVDGKETTKAMLDKIAPDQITTVDIVKYGKNETGIVNIRIKAGLDETIKEKITTLIGDDKQIMILDGKPISLEPLIVIASKIKSMHQLGAAEAVKKYGDLAKNGAVEFSTVFDNMDRKIFQEVDELPRFPGCEDLTDKPAKQACSSQKLIDYLYTRLKYPKSAKEDGIQGQVVVSFVVTEEGKLFDVKLVKDIGGGCGDEALRVVRSMQEMGQLWVPGRANGQAVATEYKLPLQFKLQAPDKPVDGIKSIESKISKATTSPVKLVPNPSSQQVQVFWDKTGAVQIEIFDISGKLMHSGKWAEFNGSQVVDIKSLSPGTYIVKMIQGTTSQEQKLMIQ